MIAPWVPEKGMWLEAGNPERLAAARALYERDPAAARGPCSTSTGRAD